LPAWAAAVVATWWIGRNITVRYRLGAAALLHRAVGVIYSPENWAQDFVPVFATATIWAGARARPRKETESSILGVMPAVVR